MTYIGLILNALCSLARDSEPLFTYGLTRSLNERKLEEGYEARRRWRAQGTRPSHAGGRVQTNAGSWDSRLAIDIGRKFAALDPAAVRMPRCVPPVCILLLGCTHLMYLCASTTLAIRRRPV